MSHHKIIVLVFVLLFLGGCQIPDTKGMRSLCVIVNGDFGQGGGLYLKGRNEHFVLTVAHGFKSSTEHPIPMEQRLFRKDNVYVSCNYIGKMVLWDRDKDLCLIKIITYDYLPEFNIKPTFSSRTYIGDPVFSVISLGPMRLALLRGIISLKTPAMIGTDARMYYGVSGYPNFSASGHVIGISYALYEQNNFPLMGLMWNVNYIRGFLCKHGYARLVE